MGTIKFAVKGALIALAFYITFEAMLTIITAMVKSQERWQEVTQRVNDHGD